MTKFKKTIPALAVVFAAISATAWLVERPTQITKAFVGHLSHERYEEAEQMLQAPSAIKVASEGGIVLVDRAGNSTAVPAERLPFFVGGGQPNGPGDFAMTALQGSTNGWLNSPAVIAYESEHDK
jgi:hypothetical protein